MSFSFDEGLRLKYALIHGFCFRYWMADGTIMAVNESLSLMQKHFDKLDERQEARFKDLENAIRESNEIAEKRHQASIANAEQRYRESNEIANQHFRESNAHAEKRYRDSNAHVEKRFRDSEKRLRRIDKSNKTHRESNKLIRWDLRWAVGFGLFSLGVIVSVMVWLEKGGI